MLKFILQNKVLESSWNKRQELKATKNSENYEIHVSSASYFYVSCESYSL